MDSFKKDNYYVPQAYLRQWLTGDKILAFVIILKPDTPPMHESSHPPAGRHNLRCRFDHDVLEIPVPAGDPVALTKTLSSRSCVSTWTRSAWGFR